MNAQVGKTKDAGYQFGLRKTFSIAAQDVWAFMFSDKGLKIWLGHLETPFKLNQDFKTKSGIEGHVRVFKPNSHVRITWKTKDWLYTSTLQVRLIEKDNNKTVISFHHEKLNDAYQREDMKTYWNTKMNLIAEELEK